MITVVSDAFKSDRTWLVFLTVFAFTFLVIFWNVSLSAYMLYALASVIVVKVIKDSREIRVTAIDISLILLLLYETVNFVFSSYPANSLFFLVQLVTVSIFFLIWSMLDGKIGTGRLMLVIMTVYGGFLALGTILQFAYINVNLKRYGFTDPHQFKSLFGYFNFPVNTWSSILFLLFVPACGLVVMNWKSKWFGYSVGFIVLALFVALALTFSRGVYLAVLAFAGVFLVLVIVVLGVRLRRLIVPVVGISVVLLVLLIPVYRPVSQTLGLLETTSQVRSASGRLDLIRNGLAMAKEHPLLGIGSGNFAMQYPGNNGARGEEHSIILSSVNNTPLQLFIEKGMLGLIFYLLPLLCCIASFYTLIKSNAGFAMRVGGAVMLAGIFAFSLKEMTYCSLTGNNPVVLLVVIWFALSRKYSQGIVTVKADPGIVLAVVIPVTCFLGWLMLKFEAGKQAERLNAGFITAVSQNRLTDARRLIDEAIGKVPNHAIYHLNKGLLIMTACDFSPTVREILGRSVPDAGHACSCGEAKTEFQAALELNPNDPLAAHSLGWLAFHRGNFDLARSYFGIAVSGDPAEPLFNLSKALLHFYTAEDSLSIVHLSKAVRVSPGVLEGALWSEMKRRFPLTAGAVEESAIVRLRGDLDATASPVLAARLARLLVQTGKTDEAGDLLAFVTGAMPNLNRPWVYLGDLHNDNADVKETAYRKAAFIDKGDFLPKLRLAALYESNLELENAILYYRRALHEILYMPLGSAREKVAKFYSSRTIAQPILPKSLFYACLPAGSAEFYCQRLGQLYERAGDHELAARFFALAERSDPDILQVVGLLDER